MNDPSTPRPTLKLKVAPRKPSTEVKATAPAPAARPSKANQKPGAHWSDEYKERMQKDMDALAR
jgi:hypothetical protein